MYLLNHKDDRSYHVGETHLHSTMYLLNLLPSIRKNGGYIAFTFHYVSIKSHSLQSLMTKETNLHSTMYLLNQEGNEQGKYYVIFTFHYVSIKSMLRLTPSVTGTNLHSTMYLLNRKDH